MPRWLLLRTSAAIAQARAEFDEALRLGAEAYELASVLDHPAAQGSYASRWPRLVTTLAIPRCHGRCHPPMYCAASTPSDEMDDEFWQHPSGRRCRWSVGLVATTRGCVNCLRRGR